MIFRTVEHYLNDENTISINEMDDECFICFEENIENKLIKLKFQKFFLKSCTCDGWLHVSCLEHWYMVRKSCPICRNNMIQCTDECRPKLLTRFQCIIFIYFYINKYMNQLTHLTFVTFVIYQTVEFYLYILYQYIITDPMNYN